MLSPLPNKVFELEVKDEDGAILSFILVSSYDQIPITQNPARIFVGVNNLFKEMDTQWEKSSLQAIYPLFATDQMLRQCPKTLLKLLKQEMSRGCSMCDVCEGNLKRFNPIFLACFTTWMAICDLWPSEMSKWRFYFDMLPPFFNLQKKVAKATLRIENMSSMPLFAWPCMLWFHIFSYVIFITYLPLNM